MRDGGLLKAARRKKQHEWVEENVKTLGTDTVIQDVFNVVIELRVNADRLDNVLKRLQEEDGH